MRQLDVCPLESVRKQREVGSDAKFVVIFLPDEGSLSISSALERWSTDGPWQMSGANGWPFVILFVQTVSDSAWWFAWLRNRSDFCCLDVLWLLCQHRSSDSQGLSESVRRLGRKGRSAKCSVAEAWALCTLQHRPPNPSCLGNSSLCSASLEKCHRRGN